MIQHALAHPHDCHSCARQEFLTVPNDDQRMVLICTDRASRGVDTSYVQHVVLFDFPRDPSEYVRRVGRTARGAGGEGVVSVLVLGRQVCHHLDVLTAAYIVPHPDDPIPVCVLKLATCLAGATGKGCHGPQQARDADPQSAPAILKHAVVLMRASADSDRTYTVSLGSSFMLLVPGTDMTPL